MYQKLLGVLRKACLKSVETGQISGEELKKYFMSGTIDFYAKNYVANYFCKYKHLKNIKISRKYLHHCIPVTELEVDQGLFQSPSDPNDKCLCFVRIIDDMENNINHPKAWRYIDMAGSLVDHQAQQQLAALRDEKINGKLANANVHR